MTRTSFKVLLLTAGLLGACGGGGGSGSNATVPPVEAVCESVGQGTSHVNDSAYQAILDKYTGSGFPGITAAIYTPQDGLWVGASGYANLGNSVAMQPCNVFFSGSVAKLYTATAAMSMVENGALNLDDTVSWHLSAELGNQLPNAQTATIEQLMNHAAGMPDHDHDDELNDYVDRNNGHLPSAEQQLAYLFDDPPRFAPGEKVEYSSAHTVALSLVMDSLAGRHHSHVVSDAIIGRLGLKETYYKQQPGYPQPPNLVSGYLGTTGNAVDISAAAINYSGDSQGDAGVIASAHDYYLFMRGLVEARIFSAATWSLMQETEWFYDDGTYALGFGKGLFVITLHGSVVKIGHSGGTLGGMSHLYYYPTTGSYIALLTNTSTEDDAAALQRWGAELLVGAGTESIMAEFEALILDAVQ